MTEESENIKLTKTNTEESENIKLTKTNTEESENIKLTKTNTEEPESIKPTTTNSKELEDVTSTKTNSKIKNNSEVDKRPKEGRRPYKEVKIDRSELLKDINLEEIILSDIKPELRSREAKRSEILGKLKELSVVRNELKENRNELNLEASQSFQKVQELKKKRNDVNKDIKEIKGIREGVLLELKQLSNREREIIDVLKESNEPGRKRGDLRRITKEIEQLEWKLQTTPNINREEEKFLMDRIDSISSKLGVAESVEAIQKEIRDLRKFKSSLKATLDDNWNRLNELVKTSQDRHNRISELYEIGKKAKEEADKKHQLLLTKIKETSNYRNSIRIIKAELDLLYPKYKSMRDVSKRDHSDRRSAKSAEMMHAKSSEIQKKLNNKKGLSISEMKFLMENRLINLKTNK